MRSNTARKKAQAFKVFETIQAPLISRISLSLPLLLPTKTFFVNKLEITLPDALLVTPNSQLSCLTS